MKKFYLFLICLFSLQTLEASLKDVLKPAKNKSDIHKIDGIDYIYMINLDERPEKFERSKQQLLAYQIHPYRFSAINGWKFPIEKFMKLGILFKPGMAQGMMGTQYLLEDDGLPHHEIMQLNQYYFAYGMSRGAIGIVLSHLSILQDALDSGYHTIWVMEDDIEVVQDPNLLSHYIQKLDTLVGKNNWDILFTDPDTKNRFGQYVTCLSFAPRPNWTPKNPERFASRQIISPEFKKIGARYGAYSMIVRRSGMRKILNFLKTYSLFLPYDMEFFLPNSIKLYSLNFDVVSTQPQALTDNGAPNYQQNNPE